LVSSVNQVVPKKDRDVGTYNWICTVMRLIESLTARQHERERIVILIGLAFLITACANSNQDALRPETRLLVELGQDTYGRPTKNWLRAVSVFNDDASLAQLSQVSKPFSSDELLWVELITQKVESWPTQVDLLRAPFSKTSPPEVVTIILGNTGGNDAFIAEDRNIAFDLAKMQSLYGPADTPANDDRIDRFFAHEVTHLLHKEWQRVHQPIIESPLEDALWDCLVEGIGNYYSLSGRWTDENGELSQHAQDVLRRLEPTFVERMSLLETASEEEAHALARGLSMGPFEEKWGALPVALWLTQEVKEDQGALRKWVDAGPWGVMELAAKYLPDDLAARLRASNQD